MPPSLAEYTKMRHFGIKIQKKISGEGAQPPPRLGVMTMSRRKSSLVEHPRRTHNYLLLLLLVLLFTCIIS